MGILNYTPDSFSAEGRVNSLPTAIERLDEIYTAGAHFVDIGAEATNPKVSGPLSADEEWQRLEPLLTEIAPRLTSWQFSIDTYHPETVERAAKLFGDKKFYVNDVTTFINPEMRRVSAAHELGAIISHMPLEAGGISAAAHEMHMDNMHDVRAELDQQLQLVRKAGVQERHIYLDPGIGFGKDMRLNWELLEFPRFCDYGRIVMGYSQKRFLATDPLSGKETPAIDRYGRDANIEAAKIVLKAIRPQQDVMLRVHDVAAHQKLLATS